MRRNSHPETSALESLREGTTDSRAAQRYYDDLAASYDETVAEWQYRAPEDASEILAPHLADGARILDVGCGTGLLASTLRRHGDYVVDGIDISAESLHLAEGRGDYALLQQHDLQDLPLPVPDDTYDAAISVGVMTYIEDAEALLRDLCRCVRRGGAITFTQRTDLWEKRNFPETIERLESDGLWTNHHISPPRQYLPGNEEFSDEINVIHALCKVT